MTCDQKKELLKALYEEYALCAPCPFLHTEPFHKVFGEGNSSATLMLIGEAPGAEEDRVKRPFVGRSGKLLDSMLLRCGLTRNDVFITNIVKCRPPNNRTPLPEEITDATKSLLRKEIELIKPRVICTLGAVATRLFMPHHDTLSRIRGKAIFFKQRNLTLIPTYHPAYILRNPSALPAVLADFQHALRLINTDDTQ